METRSELLRCIGKLTSSANLLAAELSRHEDDNSAIEPFDLAEAIPDSTLNKARRTFLTNAAAAQAMLRQPGDFVRSLALHIQLLACLQWLCEFQVLACVPLDDSVSFKDVSDLCGVPEAQLCRVTRLMATTGFLYEPRLGHIAHSPLSAQFVTDPALLDAAMFLSGTAAPTALKMPLATKQFVTSGRADQSAYAAAVDISIPLASEFELRPRLQRQFDNYLSCIAGDDRAGIRDVLMRVDWGSLGDATVVDVGAPSPSTAIHLASLFPSLHFIVQTYEPPPTGPAPPALDGSNSSGRLTPPSPGPPPTLIAALETPPTNPNTQITLQQRTPGTTQLTHPAAVYILHLPSPSPSLPWPAISAHAVSELSAHVDVLRTNPDARLVLTALVLPPPPAAAAQQQQETAGDAGDEAAARVRDLSLLQLAGGRLAELGEVVALVGGICDGVGGGLVVMGEMRVGGSAFVAWEVGYRAGG